MKTGGGLETNRIKRSFSLSFAIHSIYVTSLGGAYPPKGKEQTRQLRVSKAAKTEKVFAKVTIPVTNYGNNTPVLLNNHQLIN